MTIRNAVLGMTLVFGLAVWAWCRPCGSEAQAQGGEVIHSANEPGIGHGGTHDEAAARYRANQSHHWKQIAIGNRWN
jgi:hypothetical protein